MHNKSKQAMRRIIGLGCIAATMSACAVDATKSLAEITAPASVAYPHDISFSSNISASGGALMFDVSGAAIDSVSSSIGSAFMIENDGTGVTARVVYSGPWRDSAIATLWVHGTGTPSLTLRQAAREITYADVNLGDASLSVRKR